MQGFGELEARISRLEDIEAIKQLKARYWRCVDRKLWDEMDQVFAEECAADYGRDIKLKGRKAVVDFFRSTLGPDTVVTSHVGQRPEIEIMDDITAKGTWWLNDYIVMQPGTRRRGYAYYEDQYIREKGQWRILSTRLINMLEEWDMLKR